MATKGTSDQGKRLTPEQRAEIATATGTLKEIADKFGTSINTVARYRKTAGGGVARGRSTTRTGSVTVTATVNAQGGVSVELSRKDLIKLLLGE